MNSVDMFFESSDEEENKKKELVRIRNKSEQNPIHWICPELILVIAAVALASPAKSTPPTTCSRACPQIYDPICGKAKNGSKERLLTFGNTCVMNNFNCEHANDPYETKSTGECEGKVSVRLQ